MRIEPTAATKNSTELQMTPLIDCIFQILVFLLLTMRITTPEGDFTIRMPPRGAQASGSTDPSIHVVLRADAAGALASVSLAGRPLTDLTALRTEMERLAVAEAGEPVRPMEVVVHCDPQLDYRYTIQAITAVSGRRDAHGRVIAFCDRLRLARVGREPSN